MAAQQTLNPAHCTVSGGAQKIDRLGGAINQECKSPRAGKQVRADKQLAVYDGQRMIGVITECADRSCLARDAAGKKLGTFRNLAAAADAISEVDKIFSRTPVIAS